MIDVSALKGLTEDSRKVEDGFLFAAFKGETVDGRDFIPQAISNGASFILTDEAQHYDNVQVITEENPRKAFAHLVAKFYKDQPENIVAVTGTNGKTSVVNFVEQIWAELGYKAASLGTLSGNLTTADPVTLHKKLAALKADGINHLAMEASSHGLHQYRLDGVKIKAGGFTNLSRDHLDYHKDMDEYFEAKKRLFTEVLQEDGYTILNADSEHGKALAKKVQNTLTYGREGKDLQILSIEPTVNGQICDLKIKNETHRIQFNLVGEFQILNALCALGLVLADKTVDEEKAIKALGNLKGVPGRLQNVKAQDDAIGIYVDYAHTPDALENILKALRPHTENNLICLFGCGGDRDKGKRPEMGKIACSFADEAIVTDDNPRSEDPSSIRSDILAAATHATEIGDRRLAIHQTIQNLNRGDVLVIAGKGHEQGQIFADRTDPFDDVTEAEIAVKNIKN